VHGRPLVRRGQLAGYNVADLVERIRLRSRDRRGAS
jgi:hypothetical protein